MRPCSKCCEFGDCSDKKIFGRNLCSYHYKISARHPLKSNNKNGEKKQKTKSKKPSDVVSSTPSLSSLKKEADVLLRKLLLLKAKKNNKGRYYCNLTGEFLGEDNIHVCHYIGRECLILRWDERNCVLCSAYTNTHENTELCENFSSLHNKRFIEFLGENTAENLNKLSKETVYNKRHFITTKIEYLNEEISRCAKGIE